MNDTILHITNGVITNPAAIKLPDGTYMARFYPRKIRTDNQNAFYWVCIGLILDGLKEIGYNELRDKHDVHELMKQMFLKRRIANPETGEVIGELSRSTTELTKTEFSEYFTRIDQFCLEYLGFSLPQPNTQFSL